MIVLSLTETVGPWFRQPAGKYQLLVDDYAGTVTLQIESPSTPNSGIDTDITFSAKGVKNFYLASQSRYRVIAATAGATVVLQPLEQNFGL